MSAYLASLAELEDIAQAYAEAIRTNAELNPDLRTLAQESMAAILGGLTLLHRELTLAGGRPEEFFGLGCALVALVQTTAIDESSRRGGLVSDLIRDMEGF